MQRADPSTSAGQTADPLASADQKTVDSFGMPAEFTPPLSCLQFSSELEGHPGKNVLLSDPSAYWETDPIQSEGHGTLTITLPNSTAFGRIHEVRIEPHILSRHMLVMKP